MRNNGEFIIMVEKLIGKYGAERIAQDITNYQADEG